VVSEDLLKKYFPMISSVAVLLNNSITSDIVTENDVLDAMIRNSDKVDRLFLQSQYSPSDISAFKKSHVITVAITSAIINIKNANKKYF
jgi:hypothetical protein